MQKKQGTLIKQIDQDGNKFYIDNATGRKVRLQRANGKHQVKIPDYVFRTYRKPAPTVVEKSLMSL